MGNDANVAYASIAEHPIPQCVQIKSTSRKRLQTTACNYYCSTDNHYWFIDNHYWSIENYYCSTDNHYWSKDNQGRGPGTVVKAAFLGSRRSWVRTPIWPSSFKETKSPLTRNDSIL